MQHAVAIVADDLTGAADTGGAFATAGLATIVTWSSVALAGTRFDDHDVMAVDLETRSGDASHARDTTTRVVRAMRESGVDVIYKKCDSMLRGHVGEEVSAALAAWHPSSIAVAAFAFPAAGRTTIGGRQQVGGIPLDRPSIPMILRDAGLSTRSIDLDAIRQGSLEALLRRCRSDRIDAVVCDAETEDDIRAIARAGGQFGRHAVWVGSGGLARALPEALHLERHAALDLAPRRFARGSVLFVVGSTSKIARVQAARAIAAGARHVAVPIGALARDRGSETDAGMVSEVMQALHESRDVVVTIGGLSDVDVREHPTADVLGELLRPCGSIARGLVVTGGDTATGLLRAWNTTALQLLDEIEPGMPLAISVAPHPIPVVTKAGAFGDEASLVHAAASVRRLFI